jgi:hypothetical protein
MTIHRLLGRPRTPKSELFFIRLLRSPIPAMW